MTLDNKLVIFITGATSGLGRLAAKKCIDLGHTVIISGRSEDKLESAKEFILKDSPQQLEKLYTVKFDLGDIRTIPPAIEKFKSFGLPAIDILLNNAGGCTTEFEQVGGQIEKTVFMNAVGPLYLTETLLPYIRKSQSPNKRILFVSSGTHDRRTPNADSGKSSLLPDVITMDDIKSNEAIWDYLKYYKISKIAGLWIAYELAARNPDLMITSFCPGFVPTTELGRYAGPDFKEVLKKAALDSSFAVSDDYSTDNYLYYMTSSDMKTSQYYEDGKLSTSSPDSFDENNQRAFWTMAQNLIQEIVQQ